MEIDVRPGDEWSVDKQGAAFFRQWRDRQFRIVGNAGSTLAEDDEDWRKRSTNPLPFPLARQIIEAAGHTIREVQPEPEPFPAPTHCVVVKSTRVKIAEGTREGCEEHCKEVAVPCEVQRLDHQRIEH